MPDADKLAQAAVEPIREGMVVGLGTGRAATRAINALATRVAREQLKLTCVATSDASAQLATRQGLAVTPMRHVTRVDYLFDGADEVDPDLRLLKGRGGAMTREKIVARAADQRIYLVQNSKLVGRLGERHALPVEALDFALDWIAEQLRRLGLDPETRTDDEGNRYTTDNACHVIDARVPGDIDIDVLAAALDSTPGIIGHGLFLTEADEVIVESDDGDIRRIHRT